MTNQIRREASEFLDPATGRRVLQLTGSTMRSVHGYYDLPPWSPKDRRIVFSRMAPGSSEGEIWIVDQDGGNPRRIAESKAMTSNDGARAQWSSDGSRVYFQDRDEGGRLASWVDPDTGERLLYIKDLLKYGLGLVLISWVLLWGWTFYGYWKFMTF